jgi:riboflavin kinase/FMN adenylyltransferase
MKKAVIIGNFDGVHRGHAELLSRAVKESRANGCEPWVLTFDPHPLIVLGREPPPLLTRLPRKIELIERLGAKVHVHPFDRAFASLTPEAFATSLLSQTLDAKQVYVGFNFRFGHGRAGDVTTLSTLGDKLGFSVEIHARVGDEAGPWSSTRVRDAIGRGDVVEAERILGRWHALEGEVAKGRALGRTIGFPTANLAAVAEMLPPNGVYAVLVDTLASQRDCGDGDAARVLGRGVMNVGTRPTVAGADATTIVPEVHIHDFIAAPADGAAVDLYGQRVRVHLVRRIREERKFPGVDALKAQIEKDRDEARALLEGITPDDDAWA